jgi:hypothetical protein
LSLLFPFYISDEDQVGHLTRIEMLKFSRSLLSGIFAVSEATCSPLDDSSNIIDTNVLNIPTINNKQIAANFGAVRIVAHVFSQVVTTSDKSVSFSQWISWLKNSVDGSTGNWLSTVLECTPLK